MFGDLETSKFKPQYCVCVCVCNVLLYYSEKKKEKEIKMWVYVIFAKLVDTLTRSWTLRYRKIAFFIASSECHGYIKFGWSYRDARSFWTCSIEEVDNNLLLASKLHTKPHSRECILYTVYLSMVAKPFSLRVIQFKHTQFSKE